MRTSTHYVQALTTSPEAELRVETQITQVVYPVRPPLNVETQVTQVVSKPAPPEPAKVGTHFVQALTRPRWSTLQVSTQITQIVSRSQSLTQVQQVHENVLLFVDDPSMSAPAHIRQSRANLLLKASDHFNFRVIQNRQNVLLNMTPYVPDTRVTQVHSNVLMLPHDGVPRSTRINTVHSNTLLQIESPESVEGSRVVSQAGAMVGQTRAYPDPTVPQSRAATYQLSSAVMQGADYPDKDMPHSGVRVDMLRGMEVIGDDSYLDKDIPQSHARVGQLGIMAAGLLETTHPLMPQSFARVNFTLAQIVQRWVTVDPTLIGSNVPVSQLAFMVASETSMALVQTGQVGQTVMQPTDAYPDPLLFGSTIQVQQAGQAIAQELTLPDPTVPVSDLLVSQVGVTFTQAYPMPDPMVPVSDLLVDYVSITFAQPYDLPDPTVPVSYLQADHVGVFAMQHLETFNAHVDHSQARVSVSCVPVGQTSDYYPDPTIDQSFAITYQLTTLVAQGTGYRDKDDPQSEAHVSDVAVMIMQTATFSYPHPGKPGRFGPQAVVGYVPRG